MTFRRVPRRRLRAPAPFCRGVNTRGFGRRCDSGSITQAGAPAAGKGNEGRGAGWMGPPPACARLPVGREEITALRLCPARSARPWQRRGSGDHALSPEERPPPPPPPKKSTADLPSVQPSVCGSLEEGERGGGERERGGKERGRGEREREGGGKRERGRGEEGEGRERECERGRGERDGEREGVWRERRESDGGGKREREGEGWRGEERERGRGMEGGKREGRIEGER